MLKLIKDPLDDNSGVSMRSLRADKAYKYICKRRTKHINQEKLDHEDLDPYFNNSFVQLEDNLKQEFIWLWSELGYVKNELNKLETNLKNNKVVIDTSSHKIPTPPSDDS